MRQRVLAGLVVGLVIGFLLGVLGPVQAGARHPSDRARLTLARRVARLERMTRNLNLEGQLSPDAVVSTCVSGAPAIWQTIDGVRSHIGC